MRLVFTKGAGKYDTLDVFRGGGTPERVQCPKQGIIPHDMVHYAVEHTVRTSGFLGRVKQGEPAGFRMQPEDQSDAVERLVEVVQGDAWSGGQTPVSEMLDLYAVTCSARGCSMLPVDAQSLAVVRRAVANLGVQWQAVAVGASLTLEL